MTPHLRRYHAGDKARCLELFRSNIPRFFAPHEEAEFTEFLEQELQDCDYFVLEEADSLLGCGGVFVQDDLAGLCWGLIDNTRHRQGLGSLLLQGRLEHLYRHYPEVQVVRLDTSQHSQGFFARFGFVTTNVTPGAYAPGLDRFDMTLTREALAARVGE
jgi:predicted GNAT family N-acyltransferase